MLCNYIYIYVCVCPSFSLTISVDIWVCLKIVYPYTQWFCWSLSLLNGYFIGGIPHFQTYPYVFNGKNQPDIAMVMSSPCTFCCSDHNSGTASMSPWVMRLPSQLTRTSEASPDDSSLGLGGCYSYGHLLVIIGSFCGIIPSINGVFLVLITGILGHNCTNLKLTLGSFNVGIKGSETS